MERKQRKGGEEREEQESEGNSKSNAMQCSKANTKYSLAYTMLSK
jgi:hypothetical protein